MSNLGHRGSHRAPDQPIGILVTARDRISTTARTLRTVIETTDDHHPVLVVLGAVPARRRRDLEAEFAGTRVSFSFHDRPLMPAAGRNIGLAHLDTELVAIVDSDVVPRPGWFEALVDCQRATGAAAVVPVVLERPNVIHCAGTDLYVDIDRGAAFGHKHLHYFQMPYHDAANLRRARCDHGELHCQLVQRRPHLELGAFDDAVAEGGEVDQGLTLAGAGLEVWFEPGAVVLFDRFGPLDIDDADQFAAKWDPAEILRGFDHFHHKWRIDISEHGRFQHFVADTNAQLGALARRTRSRVVMRVTSRVVRVVSRSIRVLPHLQTTRRRQRWGGDQWRQWVDEVRRRQWRPGDTSAGAPDHGPGGTSAADDRATPGRADGAPVGS